MLYFTHKLLTEDIYKNFRKRLLISDNWMDGIHSTIGDMKEIKRNLQLGIDEIFTTKRPKIRNFTPSKLICGSQEVMGVECIFTGKKFMTQIVGVVYSSCSKITELFLMNQKCRTQINCLFYFVFSLPTKQVQCLAKRF